MFRLFVSGCEYSVVNDGVIVDGDDMGLFHTKRCAETVGEKLTEFYTVYAHEDNSHVVITVGNENSREYIKTSENGIRIKKGPIL